MTENTSEVTAVRNLVRYVNILQKAGVEYFLPDEELASKRDRALDATDDIIEELNAIDDLQDMDGNTLRLLNQLCHTLQNAVGREVIARECEMRNFSIKSVSLAVEEANHAANHTRDPADPPVEGVDETQAYRQDGMAGVEHLRGTKRFLKYDERITKRMSRQ